MSSWKAIRRRAGRKERWLWFNPCMCRINQWLIPFATQKVLAFVLRFVWNVLQMYERVEGKSCSCEYASTDQEIGKMRLEPQKINLHRDLLVMLTTWIFDTLSIGYYRIILEISAPLPTDTNNMQGFESIHPDEHRQVFLDCSVEGQPDPEITWYKVRMSSNRPRLIKTRFR